MVGFKILAVHKQRTLSIFTVAFEIFRYLYECHILFEIFSDADFLFLFT